MKAGQVVAGRYRLEQRLGVGGMGEVWSALHTGTGRDFAIKFMHAHAAQSENARQRFSREARASAKINHPNIIDVFDVGEMDDGVLYLVMELLDGVSLGDAFHAEPPLTVQDFFSIVLDTSQALSAAHAVGIIHRDVKPANIFLHKDRSTGLAFAKILDFGISKFTNDDVGTKTGSILGSPRYMSPEQTRSAAAADARADIWAMGVMLFEGMTGTWPHEGDSFSALVVNICTLPPKSIDDVAPHLPESVRAIVRDCLKPIDERMRSTNELTARVEAALADPALANFVLPKPEHGSGEGIKSTTGLRVRPPSLSSSKNQQRDSLRNPPPQTPPTLDPAPTSTATRPIQGTPSQQPPPRPPTHDEQTASLPSMPSPNFQTQVMPGTDTLASDAMTLAVEPQQRTPLPQPIRPAAGAPISPPTQPFPAYVPAPRQSQPHGFEVPRAIQRPMEMQQTAALTQSESHPDQQRPRPPDPLVASVSAMNIEIGAPDPRLRGVESSLARTPSLQDSVNASPASQRIAAADPAPLPSFGPRSSTRRLGIAVFVLAVALLGIVGALVVTIQSTPASTDAHAEPTTSAAAAAPGPQSAPPVVSPAAEPTPAPTPEPTVEKTAPSASAVASSQPKPDELAKKDEPKKDDVKKKDEPKKAVPRVSAPPPPKAADDTKKPPKHVQDLGSGL